MERIESFPLTKSLICGKVNKPFFTFRRHSLVRAANYFVQNFDGKILYAVKTNPEKYVLESLYSNNVRSFDVASLDEVQHVTGLFPELDASKSLFFMHPVKPRYAIKSAYFDYGIRNFSLDCEAELQKILEETNYAKDLALHVRIAIPNSYAELDLAEKFGVSLQHAPDLLNKVAAVAARVGVCFHAGSQCMHPDAYKIAMGMAFDAVLKSDIKLDMFNVGGGFPSIYPGMVPPPMNQYFNVIHREFAKVREAFPEVELLAEPGRALVAECMSLIARVDLRKDDVLYINEGTYGSLFDAGSLKFIFPVKMHSNRRHDSSSLYPFSFYGPTCDSLDFMRGPFNLPEEIGEGDYIEIGQVGAYGRTMATKFNGFSAHDEVFQVADEPLMSMYPSESEENNVEVLHVRKPMVTPIKYGRKRKVA